MVVEVGQTFGRWLSKVVDLLRTKNNFAIVRDKSMRNPNQDCQLTLVVIALNARLKSATPTS